MAMLSNENLLLVFVVDEGRMVTVRGGGETYTIASGQQMPWESVPDWFKSAMVMQREEPECVGIKDQAQKCINDKSFWHDECTKLSDAYHLCAANALRRELPSQPQTGKKAESQRVVGGS